MPDSLITEARSAFHRELLEAVLFNSPDKNNELVPSNADKNQKSSRFIAAHIAAELGAKDATDIAGQSKGSSFESAVTSFVLATLPALRNLRPGDWRIENVGGSRGEYHLAKYEPYTHLDELAKAIERDRALESALGNSYTVSPDILITRAPESDETINRGGLLVDSLSAHRSIIRRENSEASIVHAIISCKWTLRSDRAQNARAEALSIIRNRKGRTPHIAVVTAEPTPSRLASLALGTGDLDMVYHFALPELINAVSALGNDEASTMLETLVRGHRLRDISDLPLDLTV